MEWEAPVQRLILQLDDIKITLKGIDQTKNQLRPELERMTIELTSLLGAQNSRVEPLLEFPRILKSILSNKQVGAMVFGTDGEKLLFNDRAQYLLAGSLHADEGDSHGIFKTDGVTHLTDKELPWAEALSGTAKKLEDSELIVKRPGQTDRPMWLRVTVSNLSGPESGEIGGVIAFLADITEHVAVVNELTNLCGELEQRLDNITLASKELDMLSRKLTRVRSQDIELADSANKEHENTAQVHPDVYDASKNTNELMGEDVKVLVADDVAVNQKLLKLQLERMGFAVTLVKSGSEAVDAVRSDDFDLILMDCDMPEVDGYEATTQIRSLNPEKAQIPIIAVTAYDREGDREKCLAVGMNDFITKGSPETLLRQSITKWLPAKITEGEQSLANRARVVLFDDAREPSSLLSSRAAEGPIDIKQLESTYGAAESEAILRLFVGVSGTFVECLELAVESKDSEAVSHFAYSIKGPCASLGLSHMARKATQLAECGVKNRWREAISIYQELKEFYAPVDKQIAAILSQLPVPEATN